MNIRGGPGNIIPVDVHNEHLNHALETAGDGMGTNVAKNTILLCGKSLNGIMQMANNFDLESEVHPVSTQHTCSLLMKDEDTVLEELVDKSHVFDYIPGRQHRTFAPNLAVSVNKDKLCTTIKKYKQELQCKANVAKFYHHHFLN